MECPFCKEEIQDGAVLCKHCKSKIPITAQPIAQTNSDTETTWYYETKGQRVGPLQQKDIVQKIRNRELSHGSLVWRTGLSEWTLIEKTEFQQLLNTPPPLSGDVINNTAIWFLAFAPLISTFILEPVVSNIIEQPIEKLWGINLGLNILFSYIDSFSLKKAGHDPDKLGMGAAWIVPVYLYKRAIALKQTPSYFIVWIVSVLISIFQ